MNVNERWKMMKHMCYPGRSGRIIGEAGCLTSGLAEMSGWCNLGPLDTPNAAGDEARDGWTFSIITPDGLAAIQPDYLHFAIFNLAEKRATYRF